MNTSLPAQPSGDVLSLVPRLASRAAPPKAKAPQHGYFHLARGPMLVGTLAALVLFGVFGLWAATAPLVSGAIAPGIVSPDSSRRVIQHLEGGIVRAVHVHEGQQVKQGDLLVTLDSIRAEATYSARREQWLRLLVTAARLDALALGRDHVTLPPELERFPTAELTEFAKSQIELFNTRRNGLVQQQQILRRQIDQARNQIVAIMAQNEGLSRQADLIGQEIESKSKLLEQQLINRSEVLVLQREQASFDSSIAANKAKIAQTEQGIAEIELKLEQAGEQFRDQVAQEATDVNDKIASIEEDMVATGDILNRTELYSPVDGTVINLKTPAPGGVVRAGEPIMDIVPLDDELVVVARLNPRFIDLVRDGLTARVQLLPFQNRDALPLIGTVVQIGADAQTDEATRQSFYEVRIEISVDEIKKYPGIYLSPGMPAEVIIVTGERTMLDYLLEPVIRTLRTAFVYD